MPIFGVNQSMNPLPTNQIKTMRAQGMDNNSIIQSLQKEGFSISNIFDAMNQVDMPGFQPTPKKEEDFGMPQNQSSNSFQDKSSNSSLDLSQVSTTEELVEAIIDEKWSELADNINKIVDWKNSTNDKVVALEQKFHDLKSDFDKVHKALLGKLERYDESIGGVNANVSAMEKTFSKMLPLFSENIAELSRVVSELKESKKLK
jgi:DNA-binding transcriptional MerR regulator